MSIRQGIFRIGETVEISATFTNKDGQPMDPTGITLYLRKPDQTLDTINLTTTSGVAAIDIPANAVGTWKTRLEWDEPTPGNEEGRFEVVASTVL